MDKFETIRYRCSLIQVGPHRRKAEIKVLILLGNGKGSSPERWGKIWARGVIQQVGQTLTGHLICGLLLVRVPGERNSVVGRMWNCPSSAVRAWVESPRESRCEPSLPCLEMMDGGRETVSGRRGSIHNKKTHPSIRQSLIRQAGESFCLPHRQLCGGFFLSICRFLDSCRVQILQPQPSTSSEIPTPNIRQVLSQRVLLLPSPSDRPSQDASHVH